MMQPSETNKSNLTSCNPESPQSRPLIAKKDEGIAWLVLLASFVSHFIQYGIVWTGGVFHVIFLENVDGTTGSIALISSICTASFYMAGHYIILSIFLETKMIHSLQF